MAGNNRFFERFDFILIIPMLTLLTISVMFIYSSGVSASGISMSVEWLRQLLWIAIGLALMISLALVRYEYYRDFAIWMYIVSILLVLLASLIGRTVNGARAWIGIGGLGIQPSEFLKLSTILFLGIYLERWGDRIQSLGYLLRAAIIVIIPMGFILFAQDLGTASVFVAIFIAMVFVAGAKPIHILYICSTGVLTVTLTLLSAWNKYLAHVKLPIFDLFTNTTFFAIATGVLVFLTAFSFLGWRLFKRSYFMYMAGVFSVILIAFVASALATQILKAYQMKRLIIFMDPYFDQKGSGWNIIQSVTAVGSGGLWGKGYLHGIQSHLRYLPEQSTDFIFSIITEEWGFMGAVGVFSCFGVILGRGIFIMSKAKDRYGAIIGAGLVTLLAYHIIINIGMATGVMPVVGIPLPFLSYGGSALMTSMACMGIMMSVNAYKYQF